MSKRGRSHKGKND